MAQVEVAVGLKDAFLRRHRRDGGRAANAWIALVNTADKLAQDPFHGTQIPKDRFPRLFKENPNLWKLDLPHAFRAVYTVMGRPSGDVRVVVRWIGGHKEYDKLFGYR